MKNIKEVIIGVFAVIGFAAIVTGFTNGVEVNETQSGTYILHNSPDGKVILLDSSSGEAITIEENYSKIWRK
tara:strand:+ start:14336 stop:14551 length:216 start_codon:yes stop_codon:yes gene_type:complete